MYRSTIEKTLSGYDAADHRKCSLTPMGRYAQWGTRVPSGIDSGNLNRDMKINSSPRIRYFAHWSKLAVQFAVHLANLAKR